MHLRKLLLIGVVLIAASLAISAISATSTTETKIIENNVMKLNDVQFKILDGYTEVEEDMDSAATDDDNSEDIDGTAVDAKTTVEFKNPTGDKIEYTVGFRNNGKIDSISPAGYQEKTIGDKKGFFKTDEDDGKTEYKFEYIEDGKIVKVVTNSEDVLNQVLA
ncbi:MAG: hypothetical protein Q4Q22_08200 [Methanosphaera sp.]|nr:hypothetical protein [Methanosphaera sp.]